VGGSALEGLFREERSVNASEDHPCAALARHAAELISAKCIAGVDADADDVAGLDDRGIYLFQALVDEGWISVDVWGSGGEHEEPTGSNNSSAKGNIARID
jgi:hypothetical protein